MNLNAEYINPFLEAVGIVFKSVLNVRLRRGKLAVKENTHPSMEIAIIIGIEGGITGQIVYSMDFNMVQKIADVLMPGMSDEQMKSEYADIIGEIANMITGNAMNLLAATDKVIDITTPQVVDINHDSVEWLQQTTIGIILYSPMGQLELNIALS